MINSKRQQHVDSYELDEILINQYQIQETERRNLIILRWLRRDNLN